jgi:hypothetical protein
MQTVQQTRGIFLEPCQSEAKWAKMKTAMQLEPVSAEDLCLGPSSFQRAQTMWQRGQQVCPSRPCRLNLMYHPDTDACVRIGNTIHGSLEVEPRGFVV